MGSSSVLNYDLFKQGSLSVIFPPTCSPLKSRIGLEICVGTIDATLFGLMHCNYCGGRAFILFFLLVALIYFDID